MNNQEEPLVKKETRYFVTSDQHLGHWNIARYCNRPFRTLEDMNRTIIERHNARVKPDDWCLMLGDFCFKNSHGAVGRGEGDVHSWNTYWRKMNGNKVLAKGNHDKSNSAKTPFKYLFLEFGGRLFGATHRPEDVFTINAMKWHVPIDYWFIGHVHNSWPRYVLMGQKVLINVCLDVWNFYPVRLDEIIGQITKKDFKPEPRNLTEYLNRGRHNES